MSNYAQETRSQPAVWRRCADLTGLAAARMPAAGQRVLAAGCGTSFYIADAYAILREDAGGGETDACAASQAPAGRRYDAVVAISRSGTTSEVIDWLDHQGRSVQRHGIVGAAESPVARRIPAPVVLDFADERSLVQTRFATGTLAFLRASLGHDVAALAALADTVLAEGHPFGAGTFEHFVFLGDGFGAALAQEAALKMRETTGVWTEAYAAPEYRHGPVSAATDRTLVWALGPVAPDVLEHSRTTGAATLDTGVDPMVELVRVHLQAEAEAQLRGRDIDNPPHLARSVVLSA